MGITCQKQKKMRKDEILKSKNKTNIQPLRPDNLFSCWTKKYSLSKTLRFELKPVEQTKPFLQEFIKSDTKRDKDYKNLKKIIDEYHKAHIQEALSQKDILSVPDLENLSKHIKNSKTNKTSHSLRLSHSRESRNPPLKKKTKILLRDIQTKLRKRIKDHFTKAQAELRKQFEKTGKKSTKSSLFEKELLTEILPNWLNKISWEEAQHKEEFKNKEAFENWKKESLKIVKTFDKFTTYLTGFHENRKNIYSDKEQSTAISHRIIHENFPRFLSNRETYKKIKNKYSDLKTKLEPVKTDLKEEFSVLGVKNIEELFEIKLFNKLLSQKGIDSYNYIIGGKQKEGPSNKIQGINEKINLYRQQKNSASSNNQDIKTKLSNKNLPLMQVLHKQILSDKQSHSFYDREEFKNREEVLSALDEFWQSLSKTDKDAKATVLEKLKILFTKQLSNSLLDGIYFKNSALEKLSHKYFEDYRLINSSLNHYAENQYIRKEEDFKTKKEKEKWLKKDFFNFEEIHSALLSYSKENEDLSNNLKKNQNILLAYLYSQFNNKLYNKEKEDLLSHIKNLYQKVEKIPHSLPKPFNKDEIKTIHEFLHAFMGLFHLVKPVHLNREDLDKDTYFYNEFEVLYEKLLPINKIYDKIRNYITKNKKHLEKIKLNFENSQLADGWDVNKETDYLSIILRKKEKGQWIYYLGVMNQQNRKLFDYHLNFNDHKKEKIKIQKQALRSKLLAEGNETNYYEKMNYKQIAKASKDIHTLIRINGQVYRKTKHLDELKQQNFPPEIWKIKKNNSYKKGEKFSKKDLIHFINYYKDIAKNYWKSFNLSLNPAEKYESFEHFTDDIASQGYKLSFDKIKSNYIEEKVKQGELYLFQIHSKDFSPNSKGRPNLHTSYFKLLFEEENLKNTIFKLNGQAEVFYRKASKGKTVTHHKNQSIKNKNPLNSKKNSTFKYDLIKDKRFTADKFFFHTPITLNFKEKEKPSQLFNQEVLKFLKSNKNINIIGIDRGERHLAYWTLLNQKGDILKQGSFNQITTSYKNKKGQEVKVQTPYHSLLENREKERDKARKTWGKIESIKELKSGLLSHLVHQIAKLMVEHNAIVVFEDLNSGFKRGRMKFEKQIYQKLEKALIDKLNYLVFKDKKQAGSFLNAYQLTAPFESFQKLGKQTGFIFYTPAYYTSKVCPLTGFVNLIYPRYENVKKSQDFFKNFEKIYFDSKAKYFVFEYYDGKVNPQKKSESNSFWKVCSYGEERYKYDRKNKIHKKINVTQKLKSLFEKYKVPYKEGKNLIEDICKQDKKDFWQKFIDLFRLIIQLRQINPNAKNENERDYILSPVTDKNGRFFDSRKAKNCEPKNADANGAYHIGLKGKMILDKINQWDETTKKDPDLIIKNKDWFEFIRKKTQAKPKKSA